MSKKVIKPEWSTTVDPSEYDIDSQVKQAVKMANSKRATYIEFDVGKLWGLYQAWKCLSAGSKKDD